MIYMAKNKKLKINETENDEEVNNPPNKQMIFGAFIKGSRIVQSNLTDDFLIKLSSITMLYDTENREGCVFYTYKDCCYFVSLSADEVRKAINSFIFEPETHWESYRS